MQVGVNSVLTTGKYNGDPDHSNAITSLTALNKKTDAGISGAASQAVCTSDYFIRFIYDVADCPGTHTASAGILSAAAIAAGDLTCFLVGT